MMGAGLRCQIVGHANHVHLIADGRQGLLGHDQIERDRHPPDDRLGQGRVQDEIHAPLFEAAHAAGHGGDTGPRD